MQERDGRIKDAAQVFDEMPIRVVLEDARVLLLGEASRVQDAVGRMLRRCTEQRCADAATSLVRRVGRRSCGAKTAVRRDELGGASMQPSTAVLQEVTRVCQTCFSSTCA
jgi:hypothetical protein